MSDENRVRLELFSDYVCPWCYLNAAGIARLLREHEVDLRWRHFPLHADTPAEGLALETLFGGRDMSAMHRRLEQLMAENGLDYAPARDRTYNTRLAQELASWGVSQGKGMALHMALFRAYFVDTRNLADHAVLLEVAEAVGLPREEAARVLDQGLFREAVDSDWQSARDYGLGGVPALIGGGYVLSGYQPYGELERFLRHAEAQQARA